MLEPLGYFKLLDSGVGLDLHTHSRPFTTLCKLMPYLGDTSPSALGLFNHTQSTMDCTRPPLEDLHPMAVTSVRSPSNEFGDTDIVPLYNPTAPRTLVVCFDDTGEQFNSDVRTSRSSPHRRPAGGCGASTPIL